MRRLETLEGADANLALRNFRFVSRPAKAVFEELTACFVPHFWRRILIGQSVPPTFASPTTTDAWRRPHSGRWWMTPRCSMIWALQRLSSKTQRALLTRQSTYRSHSIGASLYYV